MILYENGGAKLLSNVLCHCSGSVQPKALAFALPPAVAAAVLSILKNEGQLSLLDSPFSVLHENQAWSGFVFLVGFLIVFRTSQAYNRFWDGCTATHQMRAEWFDACSALVSFCRYSKAAELPIMQFKNTLVRLFSMLHVAALAELEEINCETKPTATIKAYGFQLIDAVGIDEHSLHTIQQSTAKVELIFEWIQLLIVENIETGVLSIPPPILSRAFQEIANGMVAFHDALKMTYIPFPFPYAQACDCCLFIHWIGTPLVTTQWVKYPIPAFLFVGAQIFILWSLNFIAMEIENPFGTDSNDLDGEHMQCEMNRNLMLLLQPDTIRTPRLAVRNGDPAGHIQIDADASFLEVWRELPPRMEPQRASVGSEESAVKAGPARSARKGEKFIRALKHADEKLLKHAAEKRLNDWGRLSGSENMDDWMVVKHGSMSSIEAASTPAIHNGGINVGPCVALPVERLSERLSVKGEWEAVGPVAPQGPCPVAPEAPSENGNDMDRPSKKVSFYGTQSSGLHYSEASPCCEAYANIPYPGPFIPSQAHTIIP